MSLLGCRWVCWQHWTECDSPFCLAVHVCTCCTYMFKLHDFMFLTPAQGHRTLVIFLEMSYMYRGASTRILAIISLFALTAEYVLNSVKLGAVKIHEDHRLIWKQLCSSSSQVCFYSGRWVLWAAPVYSSQAVTHENTESRCTVNVWHGQKSKWFSKVVLKYPNRGRRGSLTQLILSKMTTT